MSFVIKPRTHKLFYSPGTQKAHALLKRLVSFDDAYPADKLDERRASFLQQIRKQN